mmetsp:Transcript_39803/g.89140  ORF Transcript_39803/g.89140 Transcript_39803/m.89140 type:complete len:591 (+) Transcript_39803:247-2019(+)
MRRSVVLFWAARVDLLLEYEPLLPKFRKEDFSGSLSAAEQSLIRDASTGEQALSLDGATGMGLNAKGSWQLRCLQFQESLAFTALVCGLVVFEFVYVLRAGGGGGGGGSGGEKGPLALEPVCLLISGFLALELAVRFANWRACKLASQAKATEKQRDRKEEVLHAADLEAEAAAAAAAAEEAKAEDGQAEGGLGMGVAQEEEEEEEEPPPPPGLEVGGFCSNPYRLLDTLVVALDLAITAALLLAVHGKGGGLIGGGGGSDKASGAKAAVGLARLVRLARLGASLRGCRLASALGRLGANLVHRWRKLSRPKRVAVAHSIKSVLAKLEESSTASAGRELDPSRQLKQHLDRTTQLLTGRIAMQQGAMQQGGQNRGEVPGEGPQPAPPPIGGGSETNGDEVPKLLADLAWGQAKVSARLAAAERCLERIEAASTALATEVKSALPARPTPPPPPDPGPAASHGYSPPADAPNREPGSAPGTPNTGLESGSLSTPASASQASASPSGSRLTFAGLGTPGLESDSPAASDLAASPADAFTGVLDGAAADEGGSSLEAELGRQLEEARRMDNTALASALEQDLEQLRRDSRGKV